MRTTTCGLALLLTLFTLLALSGCGGTTWINKELKGSTRPGRQEVLILPIEAHRFPDNLQAQVRKQVTEEVLGAFSDFGVSGVALRERLLEAGFGNIHWQLAQGMYIRARHHKSGELTGQAHEWLRDLRDQTKRFLLWANQALGLPAPQPGSLPALRYLLACYADRFARSESPRRGVRLHLRVTCGIYDAHLQGTLGTTWETHEVPPTPEALRSALTGVGPRLRQSLAREGL